MSDNRQDEYLAMDKYAGHETDADGFAKFQEDDFHYFSKLNADGKVIFISQGYTSEAGRNNGIESVKKNMPLEERYEAIEHSEGKWYLSLKAGNRQEIAVSPLVDSKDAALAFMYGGGSSSASSSSKTESSVSAAVPGAALAASSAALVGFLGSSAIGETSSTISKIDKTKTIYYTDDIYLNPSQYSANVANKSVVDGDFIQFAEGDKFYWALLDSEGKVAIRSQGYGSGSDRDSAIKNIGNGKNNGANYSILETREGKYYVLLRDGDNKEIGRSAAFSSRAAAVAFVPETTVTYQSIASGAAAAGGFAAMSSKASSAMSAAAASSFVAKSAPAAAKIIPTAFAAVPAIAVATAKAAPAALPLGKLIWAAVPIILLPLLLLLAKPAPTLVPLKATIAAAPPPPPPPVVPPPIPEPIVVAKVGPKQGVKSGRY